MSRHPRRPRFAGLILAAVFAVGSSLFVGCLAPSAPPKPKTIMPQKPRMPVVPPRVETPIDANLQQRAQAEIGDAFGSSDPVLRAQSLEAVSRTNDPSAGDRILRGLTDPDPLVRFAAAMCAGDLKNRGAFAALRATAADKDDNVRVAVRYALHQLGDKSLSHDLEAMSQNPNPRVRGNVATVLGKLNEPTALTVLKPMLTDLDAGVRLQVSEAMWRLGSQLGLENLVAGTVSAFADEQVVCILALAAPHDQRVADTIRGKLSLDSQGKEYPEVQLVAARALGMLNGDDGYGVAVTFSTSNDPRQRALAALALGDIGRTDGQDELAKLLTDREAGVRLAAATAIRQIGQRR